MTQPVPAPAPLGREYWDFFIALSSAFQRAQMYPGGHPILERAVGQVLRRLEPVLADREVAHFAVGATQLFVSGAATDPDHLLLRELAGRLFRRNVGAVRIFRGITPNELTALLQALTSDRADALRVTAPHVELESLSFDALALDQEGATAVHSPGDDVARAIWGGIARAMLGDAGEAHEGGFDDDPLIADLAREYDALPPEAGRDERVIHHLREAAQASRGPETRQAVLLRRQITRLLRELRPATIERLLGLAGSAALTHGFLSDLIHLASAPVALEVLQAATRIERRTMSPALLQLLSKIASHAEQGSPAGRRVADQEFREAVRNLIGGWDRPEGSDESELEYEETLDHLPAPLVPDLDPTEAYRSDPYRILTMSLDMADLGDAARRAIRAMVARGKVPPLVRILDDLPPADPLVPAYRPLVATPDAVAALLRVRPVDIEALERLAPEVGIVAAPFLFDALAQAEERSLRSRLLALLARFGNAIVPLAIQRYAGTPWYVQRNLLRLLQMLPEPPAEAVIGGFAEHPDARVRVEGLRLLLRHPAARARGIAQALADPDHACVRVGVMAATEACPVSALPLLMRRVVEQDLDEDLRPSALRALAGLDDPRVLTLLLKTAGRRVPLLGWWVAPRSRDMLAALGGLARHWYWHPQVLRLLARAERHRDPEVRRAVEKPDVLEQLGLEPAGQA
ncbi:MAG: hypothetical protein ACRENB_10900 [Gemmatimonadales bacterium]